MVLLIGTVIYASNGNCVRQLRKGVTLDFPLCIYIYVFYCIILVTIFFLIFHQLSCPSHVMREFAVSVWGTLGLEGLLFRGCYLRMLLGHCVPCAFVRGYQQVVVTFQLLLVFHLQRCLQRLLGRKQ